MTIAVVSSLNFSSYPLSPLIQDPELTNTNHVLSTVPGTSTAAHEQQIRVREFITEIGSGPDVEHRMGVQILFWDSILLN